MGRTKISDMDTGFIEDALQFASIEARYHMADSLACHLHNTGYGLEANKEANDVEWFARNLWHEENPHAPNSYWDQTPEEIKDRYRATARTVLKVLPSYQQRVALRLIELSKVIKDIWKAEHKQYEAATKKRVRRD